MRPIFVFLFFVLIAPFASAQESDALTHMPAWTLSKQNGESVSAADYAGKPVILHFWATWCPYCKKLQPTLDRLSRDYADQGLEVLAVSIREDDGAKPQDVLDERGFQIQTLLFGEELAAQFQVAGTPTTVFIGPDGKILGRTMQSDPTDPQWESVAKYLVGLNQN